MLKVITVHLAESQMRHILSLRANLAEPYFAFLFILFMDMSSDRRKAPFDQSVMRLFPVFPEPSVDVKCRVQSGDWFIFRGGETAGSAVWVLEHIHIPHSTRSISARPIMHYFFI